MFHFRALNVLAAGIGYMCVSSLDKWRHTSFKVSAQPHPRYKRDAMAGILFRHGVPRRDILLNYPDIQVSYDNRNKVPNWVLEHLTIKKLTTIKVQSIGQFEEEPKVFVNHRSTVQHYSTLEGMHRVRLACGKNHRDSQENYNATLKLSTVAPQDAYLNQFFWNDLDGYMRYLTAHYKDVYIFTGPLFLLEENSNEMEYDLVTRGLIGVPTHFYKMVIARRQDEGYDLGCYFLPNEAIANEDSLSDYRIPLGELEEKAGFRLFKNPETKNTLGCLLDVPDFRQRRKEYMEAAGLMCAY
uniref:DNA/RNA non-specific endonuclease domain-containing protein n=1 Tax=Strigamia maritima TaxID=126957 RepID=T1JF88_STRMM